VNNIKDSFSEDNKDKEEELAILVFKDKDICTLVL
jgi:hypothetical protein